MFVLLHLLYVNERRKFEKKRFHYLSPNVPQHGVVILLLDLSLDFVFFIKWIFALVYLQYTKVQQWRRVQHFFDTTSEIKLVSPVCTVDTITPIFRIRLYLLVTKLERRHGRHPFALCKWDGLISFNFISEIVELIWDHPLACSAL